MLLMVTDIDMVSGIFGGRPKRGLDRGDSGYGLTGLRAVILFLLADLEIIYQQSASNLLENRILNHNESQCSKSN